MGVPIDSVVVLYNGLDFALLEPLRPSAKVAAEIPSGRPGQLWVGTAATLQDWKRVHLLIEAVSRLRDTPIQCLIVGDGPARTSLETLTRSLNVASRVSFLGRKDNIGDYLQLLDVFVLPSGPEEAFGNAAVEAMGVGIPTIVFSDGGGLTEHVTDRATGRVVNGVTELAEAIAELARDEPFRRTLGDRGRRHVRAAYSLDAMFDNYAAFYERALERAS